MGMKWNCLAALVLLCTGIHAPAHGDTFLVIVEEFRDGEAVEVPPASQEGLMSGMFDLGHITFETGEYRPEMDWDSLEFSEPLLLTREGLGRYLAVARVFAEAHPREPGGLTGSEAAPTAGTQIAVRASYLLFDARTSRLLGRGELTASSTEGERELTYGELLFATGEKLARAIVSLRPGGDSR